jgi:uncharacterized protein (DUF305 family)
MKGNVMKRNLMIGAALAAGIIATFALAQEKAADCPMDMSKMDHSMMQGMTMSGEPKGDQGAASKAFAKANAAMHTAMDIEFTGNADADFAKGMIPHHQGAVEMAKIVLEFGKDPEIRALAEGIVKAQESEIAFMNGWLAKNVK